MQFNLFENMLENISDAIVACDAQGKLIYLNKKARELHGRSVADISIQEWILHYDLFKADGKSRMPLEELPLYRALNGEEVRNEIFTIIRKDRPPLHAQASAVPLFDDNKKMVGAMASFQDITKEKAYRDQLYRRFKAIFDQSPFSIQICGKDGKVLLINDSYRKLWNVTDELLSYVYNEYNILTDKTLEAAGHMSYIRQAYAGEIVDVPPFYYDPTALGLPGRPRWAGGTIYPLKDHTGEVQEVVIIHFDVTDQHEVRYEREKLLEQLHLERNRLQTVIRDMPAGLIVVQSNSKIILQNEQHRKMVQKEMGSLTDGLKTFRPDGSPFPVNEWPLTRTLKEGVSSSDTLIVETPCGKQKVLKVSSSPILDSEGNIDAAVGITTDITAETRHEKTKEFLGKVKSILMATLDYDQVLEKIADAAIPFLADGCMVDVIEEEVIKRIVIKHPDPETEKKLRRLQVEFPLELDSQRPSTTVIKTGKPLFLRKVDKEELTQYTQSSDHEKTIKDIGPTSAITVPLFIRGKIIGSLTVFTTAERTLDDYDLDTTKELARRAATAIDNARLYQQARKSIRLRDDFISVASHELKTPITTLGLQVKVLGEILHKVKTEEGGALKSALLSTQRQVDRLSRLVEDMLDISRIESGKLTYEKKVVDLSDVVNEIISRFSGQLEDLGIALEFISQGPVEILGDSFRMEQVMTNLMTNAIKYGNRKPIYISLEKSAHKALIKVQDHGRGIGKADQDRIFERFERAVDAEDVIGLGLGLFISRKIVQEMGGRITVSSELDKGSAFSVELPLHRP